MQRRLLGRRAGARMRWEGKTLYMGRNAQSITWQAGVSCELLHWQATHERSPEEDWRLAIKREKVSATHECAARVLRRQQCYSRPRSPWTSKCSQPRLCVIPIPRHSFSSKMRRSPESSVEK